MVLLLVMINRDNDSHTLLWPLRLICSHKSLYTDCFIMHFEHLVLLVGWLVALLRDFFVVLVGDIRDVIMTALSLLTIILCAVCFIFQLSLLYSCS